MEPQPWLTEAGADDTRRDPLAGVVTVVTHDGRFHADDVFAYATLRILSASLVLVRSRDADAIQSADLAFDVGGTYEPAARRYDHHQPQAPTRADGSPLAAFGLVWRHYGRAAITRVSGCAPTSAAIVADRIDAAFVRLVDLVDNGRREAPPDSVVHAVDMMNPTWDEGRRGEDIAFRAAARWAETLLRRHVRGALAGMAADDRVHDALARRRRPEVLELDRAMPWEGPVLDGDHPDVLYVVQPRTDGSWSLTCVPPRRGSMAQRLPLPRKWAGLRDGDLVRATGVAAATFCHANRFVAIASTRDGVTTLCDLALAQDPVDRASDGLA